jgi:hypothetical protein
MASKLSSGGSGASKTSAGSTISEKSTGTVSKPSTSSSSTKTSTASKASSSSPVSKGSSGASKTSAKPAVSLSSSGGGSSGNSTRSSTVSSRDTNAITPSLSRSLSESSSRTAASSSAEAKAKTAGRNLRGDAQSRAGAADPAVLDQLLTYEALQSAMRGTPRGDDEELTLLEQLQSPYETRVERAGGTPFEGPVDWDGITAAIFGGQSAAERDAALAAQRRGPDPSRYTPLGDENLGLSYGMLNDMYRPEIDPESGFIKDPATGTYYRPDLLPGSTRLAETSPALPLGNPFAPLDGLIQGVKAEAARLDGTNPNVDYAEVALPRRDPRGGIEAMGIPLPGQTEGGDVLDVTVPYEGESDEAKYARENPVTAPKKKTVLDSVVEGAGGLLEKTPLGGIAKSLFPDLWYGTGEAIKGIDDGVTYGSSSGRSVGTNFEDTANGGSLIEQQQPTYGGNGLQGFIDLNGNGIDDRLEGGMPPAYVQGPAPGNRVASFPTMPPYNPGRDNEWTYFSNNRLANGGIVHAYADGGSVAAEDPRMAVIAAAEDVLEKIATGSPPDEQDAAVLKEFVAKFGDAALRQLNDNVKAGMKMNPSGRRISGPGGPKDDAIPAVIDGVTPAALSDGEFVMPVSAVEGAGGGDPDRGAEALQELSERLSGRAAA